MSKKEQSIFLSNESGEGLGKFTFPDGDTYEGEFKDWDMNGQGTYTWSDGRKYVGEFIDGKIWNGTVYDKYGNIHGKYVDGEWIKN